MSATESCRIWGSSYPATVYINQDPSYAIVDSTRTGGRYKFAGDAKLYINECAETNYQKLQEQL